MNNLLHETKRNKIEELCKKYKVNLCVLFGSYVSENFDSQSDIDLAIEVEDIQLIKENKLKLLDKLSIVFNYRDIDLVLLNHVDSLLKFNVAREGKLVYQKKNGLFNEFKVRAMKEHQDARKFYQLDKKYINKYLNKGGNHDRQRVSPPQVSKVN